MAEEKIGRKPVEIGSDELSTIARDAYRQVLSWMDLCFGSFYLAVALVTAIAAFRHETSWQGFALQLFLPLFNIAFSRIALRRENPRPLEIARAIFNASFSALGFVVMDGKLDQFWFNSVAATLGGPMIIATLTMNTLYGWMAVGLGILSMMAAALLGGKHVNWYYFMLFVGYSLMVGIFISKTMSMLLSSLRLKQEKARELEATQKVIIEQQEAMVSASKMSALGEMAGGLAHEINNPLTVIKVLSHQLQKMLDEDPMDISLIKEMSSKVETTTNRIARIVHGLRTFSRDGSKDPFTQVNIKEMIDETLSFCGERFKNSGTRLIVDEFNPKLCFEGRPTEISQVLLNLLNNANDAVGDLKEKWVRVSVIETGERVEIQITDSGGGIQPEVREKIFQPFFTTKGIGKGTGMGLSISSGIVRRHRGELDLDEHCPNTRFAVRLPKRQSPRSIADGPTNF